MKILYITALNETINAFLVPNDLIESLASLRHPFPSKFIGGT